MQPVQAVGETYSDRQNRGGMVLGIRVDSLPENEAQRLAEDGEFYPLTMDANGNLRVALPPDTKVETPELEVLREIRDLLAENQKLLMQIA